RLPRATVRDTGGQRRGDLEDAGGTRLRRRDRARPVPGESVDVRDLAPLPRTIGFELARRPARARRLRARVLDRRGARARAVDVVGRTGRGERLRRIRLGPWLNRVSGS